MERKQPKNERLKHRQIRRWMRPAIERRQRSIRKSIAPHSAGRAVRKCDGRRQSDCRRGMAAFQSGEPAADRQGRFHAQSMGGVGPSAYPEAKRQAQLARDRARRSKTRAHRPSCWAPWPRCKPTLCGKKTSGGIICWPPGISKNLAIWAFRRIAKGRDCSCWAKAFASAGNTTPAERYSRRR